MPGDGIKPAGRVDSGFSPDDLQDLVSFDEILRSLGHTSDLIRDRSVCPVCAGRGSTNKSAFHAEDEKGTWYCFSGSHGGGKADLISQTTGCSRREAFRWIAGLAGIDWDENSESWKRWREIKEAQRNTLEWGNRMVTALADLADEYEPSDPAAAGKLRVQRERIEKASGTVLLELFKIRNLLGKKTKHEEALRRIEAREKEYHQSVIASASTQLMLLGAESDEWEDAFRELALNGRRKNKSGRDTRSTGSGSGAGEPDEQPGFGESDPGSLHPEC